MNLCALCSLFCVRNIQRDEREEEREGTPKILSITEKWKKKILSEWLMKRKMKIVAAMVKGIIDDKNDCDGVRSFSIGLNEMNLDWIEWIISLYVERE